MAELRDVMAYLIENYPDSMKEELSNARLTKMVYLADWHSCINGRGQITGIKWFFDNYGPFVKDIQREADRYRDLFEVHEGQNMYGATKRSFKLKKKYAPLISDKERQSLDHIIDVTKRLYWDDFIRLVYSTHPIASSERYEFLDLAAKAREYRAQKAVREEQAS